MKTPNPWRDKNYLASKQDYDDFLEKGTIAERVESAHQWMSDELREKYEQACADIDADDIVQRHYWIRMELLDRKEKAFRDALALASLVKAEKALDKEIARLPREVRRELSALAERDEWSPWDRLEWIENWRAENVARRRTITPEQKKAIWEKSNGICWYCGAQTNPFDDFRVDHFMPVVLGGDNHLDNLVPACHSCNAAKSDSPIEVFRARKGFGSFWFEAES